MKNKLSINFLYQTAYQILIVITPLVTAPYIARVLGPENNGIYTYTNAVASYFMVFAALGIEAYGNRLIAQAKNKGKHVLDETFSTVFWMHFLVAILATISYFIYVFCFVKQYRIVALAQSLLVISALIDINWVFFGFEEFKLTVIRNFIIKLLSVIGIFIFVKSKDDLIIYTLLMSFGNLFSNAVLWVFVSKYVKFVKVSLKEILFHLKPLLVLFLAVIATSIYRMIDKVMLGWFSDMTSLAAYEYADKMIKLVITVITSLGTVMLPRMSALYAEGKNDLAAKYMNSTSQFMFVMAFAIAFGLAGIANEFMPVLLGTGYDQAITLTKILCISIPIMGWNNLVRTEILMPKEKDNVYTVAVWAGAIVNIVLNYIFINLFGPIGAATATVIAYFVVGIFQTYPIRSEFPIWSYIKYIRVPLISGILMYFIVRVVAYFSASKVIGLIVEIILGAFVYLLINVIYLQRSSNEVFKEYIQKYTKKFNFVKKE